VCSQLAESSAKEVPEESSAGAKNKSSKSVLVVGATGGVGQLVVASLMERGHSVRAIIRNPEKGKALFGDQDPQQFQVSPLDQQLFT
jgi:nucleoside-diphosphate-sugar epimerase